jgi:ubiquinone/menaquinone biosynthesis C-methylase UbiE
MESSEIPQPTPEFAVPRQALYSNESLALHAAMYAWPAARVPSGWVLDIGCECGVGSQLITESNPRLDVVGVDLDLTSLRYAHRTQVPAGRRQLHADGVQLPVASRSLACLFLINVLHLVQQPDAMLAEARRTLAPGGFVVVGLTREARSAGWLHGEQWLKRLSKQLEQLFGKVTFPQEITGRFASLPGRPFLLNRSSVPWLAICSMD